MPLRFREEVQTMLRDRHCSLIVSAICTGGIQNSLPGELRALRGWFDGIDTLVKTQVVGRRLCPVVDACFQRLRNASRGNRSWL